MSGSLIPISDEQAKLAQEILKTLRGVGSFVGKALGSTPEDLIAYLGGDWLRVRRAENLARLFEDARRRLIDRNVEEPIPASLSVALPILQGAADEDREELVDLWARLLANAMDPNLNDVRYAFIEAVKKMDVLDAIVLLHIYRNQIAAVRYGELSGGNNTTGIANISKAIAYRDDEVEVSLRHLGTLSFFDTIPPNPGWYVNAVNREFMRACYPELAKA